MKIEIRNAYQDSTRYFELKLENNTLEKYREIPGDICAMLYYIVAYFNVRFNRKDLKIFFKELPDEE